MKPEPLFAAVESLDPDRGRVLALSPAGRRLDQAASRELAAEAHLTLLCGRYEGVDERVVEGLPAEEVSIGDYVLSGGELPALVLIEAVTRLVPGVIGQEESHEQDSFSEPGVLDHPALHAAPGVPRHAGPRGARFGRPRGDRGVAPRSRARQDAAQPPRPRLAAGAGCTRRWYNRQPLP